MSEKYIIYREAFEVAAENVKELSDIENEVFIETDHEPAVVASYDNKDEAEAALAQLKSTVEKSGDKFVGEMVFLSAEELTAEGDHFSWSGSDCAAWESDPFNA